MNPTRRQFNQAVAVSAIAPAIWALSIAQSRAEEPTEPLIIDTHQHLWDLSKFNLPWLADAPEVYRHSYRPQEYAQATKGLNVRTVYMEVDVTPELRPAEAEYVIDLCRTKSGATRAAVIGGNPDSPDFSAYLNRFHSSGFVRGVRQILHAPSIPQGTCLKDEFVKGVRLLGKLDMSFDLCMRPTELLDGAKLCELSPDTRFILDHCGNADPKAFLPPVKDENPWHEAAAWKRDMEALAKRPNIICKISGIVARAPEKWTADQLAPIVNHCLDTFGPDRVVFGGDWPVCLVRTPLMGWIDALKHIVASRPKADQEKLWSGNAVKFYKLDL
jgi:predicted TIM-barrel fold metal-dependent hydrolase